MEEFSVQALFAKIHKTEQLEAEVQSFERRPLQLIEVTEDNQLRLGKDAEVMLKKLTGKIAVVGVCGPQRSGKSSVLNLLVSETGRGFALDHEGRGTKGIWIWGEPVATKENSILFVDCEGCKSVEDAQTMDGKIFALMMILTSVLIFNNRGVIDENAVEHLALAACLSEIVDFSTGYADSQLEIMERVAVEAPKLVWLLRDFHLAIADDEGNPLSAKEYMENVLNMPTFMGKNASKNSKIRESLLQLFAQRDCYTLPRPVVKEKDLEIFEELSLADLRDKFSINFEKFRLGLLDCCPSKTFGGAEISGLQLVFFIEKLVSIMNEGNVPNIYAVHDYAKRVQYEEVLGKAKDKYMESKTIDPALMPYEDSEVLEKLSAAKDLAIEVFGEIANKDADIEIEIAENFQEFLQNDLKTTLKNNFSASEAYNLSLIEELYRPIILKVDQGYYTEEFEEMETDWMKAMRQYEKVAKGPGTFSAISEFLRLHQHEAFAKYFQQIYDKFKDLLSELREKDRQLRERLKKQREEEERQQIIKEHVDELKKICENDGQPAFENLLEEIERQVINRQGKKDETGMERRANKKGCTCVIN